MVKTFFRTLIKSVSSPSYYADIYKAHFSFSLKFFYAYFFLFSIVATILLFIKVIQPFNTYVQTLPAKLISSYPEDLTVTIKNGEATTNVEEPYFIPVSVLSNLIPDQITNQMQPMPKSNLLVIDTKASIEDLDKYDSYSLLTKTSLSYYREGIIQTTSISATETVVINRQLIETVIGMFTPYLHFVTPVLTLLAFIAFFFSSTTANLLICLAYGVLYIIISKIVHNPISYKKAYQFTLHAVIVPTTVFGLLGIFITIPPLPLRDTIIMGIAGFIIFTATKGKLTPIVPAPDSSTQLPDTDMTAPSVKLTPTIPPKN